MTDYKIGILMILMTSVITIAMRMGPIFIFSKGKKFQSIYCILEK